MSACTPLVASNKDVLATEFEDLHSPELARLWLQHVLLTDWLTHTEYSDEEQRELVVTKESLSLEISGLAKEKADIATAMTTAKKKLREALKNVIKQEKKHGTVLNMAVCL
jgi:hypothetical protein